MMIKACLDGSCCYDFHRGISNQEVPSGHAAPGRKEIVQAHGHPQTKLDDNIFGEYSRWGLSQLLQLPVMCARIPERYDCTLVLPPSRSVRKIHQCGLDIRARGAR